MIREVKDSKLLGRGGAAFPTGVKWEAVARQPARPHYLICNADESEPGTFKDRVVIEGDPFALIEAMTIAGYATGCEHGYVYLRGEYPLAPPHARQAHRRGAPARLPRRRRPGRGLRLRHRDPQGRRRLHLRRGDGDLQLDRGLPRRAAQQAAVPGRRRPVREADGDQQRRDAGERARRARGRRPGLRRASAPRPRPARSCSASPATSTRPGVYEVPFGTTLGELLELAGGVPAGGALQTVLLGGAAGGFVRPDELDLPLTFEARAAAKTTLGSGVVLVMDDTVDLPRMLMRIAAFFRDESCGQCVPCRVGTVRQQEALARLVGGHRGGRADELALIERDGPVHARRVDLRSRTDRVERDRVGDRQLDRLRRAGGDDADPSLRAAGAHGRVRGRRPAGEGVRGPDDPRRPASSSGSTTPTLCYGETLTPANVCRVCVVEIEGARVLAPPCSRKAEPGMKVRTDSERVRHSRRLVLEFLGSSVDLSTAPDAQAYCERVRRAARALRPAGAARPASATASAPATTSSPTALTAATVHAPVKVDNELYVRDYSKCILCYKCVDACGDQHQNTFAITVAGRGFDARISTEYVVAAAGVRLRLLRQLHRACARPAR